MDPIINLDSTALRYFQVAAEFKSVRRAAQALNISGRGWRTD
jgi:DNA-binding transcriptional LysR family regulator